MGIDSLLKREAARRDAYFGLAECYALPEKKMSLQLKEIENCFEILGSAALSQIILMRSEIERQIEIQDLKVDYSRLFVGPYSLFAPPYGSVYLEGKRQIMGDSTMDVTKWYAEAGLTTSDNFKEIPDHIRAELEFMYFLIFKEVEAIQGKSVEDAAEFLRKQASFLQDHLFFWVGDLTSNMETHSQTNFYRYLASATRIFLEEDFSKIGEIEIPQPMAVLNQE